MIWAVSMKALCSPKTTFCPSRSAGDASASYRAAWRRLIAVCKRWATGSLPSCSSAPRYSLIARINSSKTTDTGNSRIKLITLFFPVCWSGLPTRAAPFFSLKIPQQSDEKTMVPLVRGHHYVQSFQDRHRLRNGRFVLLPWRQSAAELSQFDREYRQRWKLAKGANREAVNAPERACR